MANLLAKLFKKKNPDEKGKRGNLVKRIGIVSGILWVTAMGAVYALKDMDLSPAALHGKASNQEETGTAHHGDHNDQGDEGATALADVPSVPESEHPAETDDSSEHAGESHPAEHPAQSETVHVIHPAGQAKANGHAKPDGHAKASSHSEAVSHAEAAGHSEAATAHSTAKPAKAKHEEKPEIVEKITVNPPSGDEERDALRQLADIHFSRGDLDKALHPIRRLMTVPTQDVPLLTMATQVFLGTGNYREALVAARKALRLSVPGRVDLQVAAAMSRYRLGEVTEAMQDIRKALKDHPKDLDLLTALGTMEIERGPTHRGYGESLEKALKIKPKHVPALYQMGRKAQLEGDYRDAETLFRKVLKQDPKHAKAHGQLGTALYHQRKNGPAEKEFQAALALNSKDYNTWFNLGEVQLALAAQDPKPDRIRALRTKALASYLQAVKWNRDHAEAHFRIGVILNGNAQYKEAIRYLEASRRADGTHVPTLIQLAVAFEGLKKPDRAKAYLEQALELDPTDKIAILKLRLLSQFSPEEGA